MRGRLAVLLVALLAAAAKHDGAISTRPVAPKPASFVRLVPHAIDFWKQPLCETSTASAVVINTNPTRMLRIFSVVSDDSHFRPPKVEVITLPPGGNRTLRIVFMPRALGIVAGTLTLETSAGTSHHPIRAMSVPSPFRVSPMLNIRVPLGALFAPSIRVFNPQVRMKHSTRATLVPICRRASIGRAGLWRWPRERSGHVPGV